MLIIAHRGHSSVAPENTLPSFRSALDAGAETAFSATEAAGAIEELAKLNRNSPAWTQRWSNPQSGCAEERLWALFRKERVERAAVDVGQPVGDRAQGRDTDLLFRHAGVLDPQEVDEDREEQQREARQHHDDLADDPALAARMKMMEQPKIGT